MPMSTLQTEKAVVLALSCIQGYSKSITDRLAVGRGRIPVFQNNLMMGHEAIWPKNLPRLEQGRNTVLPTTEGNDNQTGLPGKPDCCWRLEERRHGLCGHG